MKKTNDADAFIKSIAFIKRISKVKFFQPDGKPSDDWKLYEKMSWAASREAALDAAWETNQAAAWDADWDTAREATLEAAMSAAPSTAWKLSSAWEAALNTTWDTAHDAIHIAALTAIRKDGRTAIIDALNNIYNDTTRVDAICAAMTATREVNIAATRTVARAANMDAALGTVWEAALDAALLASCLVVEDKIDKKHLQHARARWRVWEKGYGLLCDINGTFYVYY